MARAAATSGCRLPVDVGEAIAGYLRRGRPADALDRAVFVRVARTAPWR